MRCGAEFGCGMEAGQTACWCAELPPVMPVNAEGCLCPKCLRAEVTERVGDCFGCAHARTLTSKGGAAMFLCGLAEQDPVYAKYPRLPTRGCRGRVTSPAGSGPI